jgi:site-specific recombinase XerD
MDALPLADTLPAPRKRGRPPGSRAKVLAHPDLGVHHFAFVRAWLQGLDVRWAWERYMAFCDASADLRYIERRRKEILASAIRLGHQLNLTLPPERQFTALLNILSKEPVITATQVLPSLDEFIALQGLDPDMYNQAELLEIYQAHYACETEGTDAGERAPADSSFRTSSSEHVRALNHLSSVLAVAPCPADPLARWLDAKLAQRLAQCGALDIARLVDLVNVYGYRWFKRVARLGETRARSITTWLVSIEEFTGLPVRPSSLTAPQRQQVAIQLAARDVVAAPSFAIVPLQRLLVPSPLSGANGVFRTNMPNTLGAGNDLQALLAWLTKYQERAHTHRSYKREVERFYLWCLHALQKPLSSVNALDCQAYRSFLAKTPFSWLNPGQVMAERDWRPFRKQLSQPSQKLALVIVQTMFEGLRDAGYLAVNPMSAVMKGFNLPSPAIQIDRSFTDLEWAHIMACAQAEERPASRTRLLLMLELFVALGLRIDELATARRTALRCVEVDGAPAWIMTVTGKRRKQREVPVPDHVVALIEQHHRDVRAMFAIEAQMDLPIVCVSGKRVPLWVAGYMRSNGMDGDQGHPALTVDDGSVEITAGGIYSALKRFFKQAADAASDPDIDPARLRRASTHWMRHTCGRQAAADDVPLEVLQQLLGHASLSTTTIYMSTERDRMVRELRKRKHRAPRSAEI